MPYQCFQTLDNLVHAVALIRTQESGWTYCGYIAVRVTIKFPHQFYVPGSWVDPRPLTCFECLTKAP